MSLREIWRLLNLPCDGVTALMSQGMDRDLSAGERWAVRSHALYCRACRRYRTQIREMCGAVRRLGADEGEEALSAETLGDDARRRMKNALRGD